MTIKTRNETLHDIIQDAEHHPTGWKALFGKDRECFSHDSYILHPEVGIYLLKEYQKNPFDVHGVGGKIARSVDEDIDRELSNYAGDFGIVQGNLSKILKNVEKGIHPRTIFETALRGKKKDLGIRMPVRGHASTAPLSFTHLHQTLSTKQKKLDAAFEKLATDEGLYTAYG
ncbi:MAG: hypothetical protein JW771_07270 [Candidatus Thermoplasmatota archaeon]|nr:hypothetical protein [Candidatus Thermoplasmatota archaeon]